jgi:hypothetical protein
MKWTVFAHLLALVLTTPILAADFSASLEEGWRHYNNGAFKKASREFERAARLDPSSAEAFKGVGLSYMKIGIDVSFTNVEFAMKAAEAFQRSLAISPSQDEVRYELGLTCLALYDRECAKNQHEVLKGSNRGLAEKLAARIASYEPPRKIRQDPVVGGTSAGEGLRAKTVTDGPSPQAEVEQVETTVGDFQAGSTIYGVTYGFPAYRQVGRGHHRHRFCAPSSRFPDSSRKQRTRSGGRHSAIKKPGTGSGWPRPAGSDSRAHGNWRPDKRPAPVPWRR